MSPKKYHTHDKVSDAAMQAKEITSPENVTYKNLLKLTNAREIKKQGTALLSGSKSVNEVLRDFPERCAGVILPDRNEFSQERVSGNMPLFRLSPNLFRRIDFHGTGPPLLLVRIEPFQPWDEGRPERGCTLLIPFQDPTNVGAVIRSAAAFGVSRVVLLKEAAHPFLPKSLRASGSAVFRVPLYQGPSLYRIRSSGAPVITLALRGLDVDQYTFPPSFCLVPGLEGPGLPDHLNSATALTIPTAPDVESLNAAQATGIALYMWRRSL